MNVYIQAEKIEIKNEVAEIDRLFKEINQIVEKSNLFFSHMNIDDVEVYENHYEYIMEKLNEIQSISIELLTLSQLTDNMMLSMQNYLDVIIPETRKISDQFYQNQNKAWETFEQLLEGLEWISSTLHSVDTLSKETAIYKNYIEYLNIYTSLQEELKSLEGAVHNKDMILIGDILKYEMIPLLEALQIEVNHTIDNEVVRNDFN